MSTARQTEILELAQEHVTNALVSIDSDHAYIHDGIAYKAHLDIGALNAGASESYSFKTPSAKYLHFKNLRLSGVGASVKVEIFRGTVAAPLTIDSAGSAASELVGPNNVNDNVTTASTVEVKKTPTYVGGASGAVWDRTIISGSSTNQFQSVAETRGADSEELVMKPNTYYVIKITNVSVGDNAADVVVSAFWYEETST